MEKEVKSEGNTKPSNEVKYFKNLSVYKAKFRTQKQVNSFNRIKHICSRSENVKNSTEKVTIKSKGKTLNSHIKKRSSQNLAESVTEDINVLINIRLAQKNARRNKVLTTPLKKEVVRASLRRKEK